ncbi:MAG TPA: DUF2085 domain-containing protein [Ktedonobacterales bacterium]
MAIPDETPAETRDAMAKDAAQSWHLPPDPWDQRVFLPEGLSPRREAFNRTVVGGLNRLDVLLREHWLGMVNGTLGAFVGLAVATPIMRAFGLVDLSRSILLGYHLFCAQTPSHSIYLDGHQICLCQRCLAIWTSLLVGGLLLAALRQRGVRLAPLDWRFYALALLPMALDGGTQAFGWRESDLILRLLTGIIFGLATAWFALPQLQTAAEPAPAYAVATSQ